MAFHTSPCIHQIPSAMSWYRPVPGSTGCSDSMMGDSYVRTFACRCINHYDICGEHRRNDTFCFKPSISFRRTDKKHGGRRYLMWCPGLGIPKIQKKRHSAMVIAIFDAALTGSHHDSCDLRLFVYWGFRARRRATAEVILNESITEFKCHNARRITLKG